jgi:hypothetical protein
LARASGKNPQGGGIAGKRQEVNLLATVVVDDPAVRWRDREEESRSRQQEKPIPSENISWQDLLFRRKNSRVLNAQKLFRSSLQKQ